MDSLNIKKYFKYMVQILIRCYIFLWDKLIVILPDTIYIQSYDYRTLDLDYSIYEYLKKHDKKYYKCSIIDANNMIKPEMCIKKDKRHIINHCAILDKDGNYIRDITHTIRSFMHYDGLIEWMYILIHIDVKMSDKLLLCMNDLNLNEKILECDNIVNLSFNLN
jgi:hypothetical protein